MKVPDYIQNEFAGRFKRIKADIFELKKFITMYSNFTRISISSRQKLMYRKRLINLFENISKELTHLNNNLDQMNLKLKENKDQRHDE
jgi:Skp family chaperone for outer membrane proteins